MMRDAIEQFNTQFSFDPLVVNADMLPPASKFIIGGMGGSGHSGNLLQGRMPELDIHIHRNYGIPKIPGVWNRNR